jgi:hypothetical protein
LRKSYRLSPYSAACGGRRTWSNVMRRLAATGLAGAR